MEVIDLDPQIRQRLNQRGASITIYPCINIVDGDKQFGTPINIKGLVVDKYKAQYTIKGEQITIEAMLYLDGAYVDVITSDDDILLPYSGRNNIKRINPIPNMNGGIELLEVLV